MSPKNELYRVCVKVKPTPVHPKFFDWQFGLLETWIYAAGIDEAGEKIRTILFSLPYELVGPNMSTQPDDAHAPLDRPELENARKQAQAVGFAMCLCMVPVGADENDFETWDFS